MTSTETGCGSSHCQCRSGAGTSEPQARVNGIALHAQHERPDAAVLRERVYAELLRQQAVQAGLLAAHAGAQAPPIEVREQQQIDALLAQAVPIQQPGADACRRYYDAHPTQFTAGQAVHLRHILFAVTPGVSVQALTRRAEQTLLELVRQDVPADRFAERAAELSNCPSGAQGGDLGWVGPQDCAPELGRALFHQPHTQWGLGVHPRLVPTRFGFHIIEVLARREGRLASFEAVHERIAAELALHSRARALHQYMSLLVGQARLEGVDGLDLAGADSPLVQ